MWTRFRATSRQLRTQRCSAPPITLFQRTILLLGPRTLMAWPSTPMRCAPSSGPWACATPGASRLIQAQASFIAATSARTPARKSISSLREAITAEIIGRAISNGDVLYADFIENVVRRLLYVPISGGQLPSTLGDTGAFTNLSTLQPHAGVVPYDVTVPSWSDGAIKHRWFSIPNVARTITFRTP